MTPSASSVTLAVYIVTVGALIDIERDTKVEDHSPFDHYNFIKDHSLITCVPAKTGTTSFYLYIYHAVFGRPWPYSMHEPPFVNNLYSWRWHDTFTRLEKLDIYFSVANQTIAVVRDPVDRILSGWRSKLACESMIDNVDLPDQDSFVQQIYKLAGVSHSGPNCMSFATYVNLLEIIHKNGHDRLLQAHFLPQQYGCFDRVPVEQWDLVAPISSPVLKHRLQDIFGTPYLLHMPHQHASSKSYWVTITPRMRSILDNITRAEYTALGSSLDGGHAANVEGAASGECPNVACGRPCSQRDGVCLTW